MDSKQKMTKRERVITAMNLQETDRAPLYDMMLNDAAVEHFTGVHLPLGEKAIKARCKAISAMLDMTRGADIAPHKLGEHGDDEGFISHWDDRYINGGYVKRPFSDVDGAAEWLKRSIDRLKMEFQNINLKKFSEDYTERFKQVQSYIGDDTVMLLRQSGTGLDEISSSLGLEIFSYVLADEPELIFEYMEVQTRLEIEKIHAVSDNRLSPCTLTYGDIGGKGALLYSPKLLRAEFFPRLKSLNNAYHQHDIKCLYHSDGYLMEVIDDLIAAGIDGLNPIEILAGMDLRVIKEKYGSRIFLTGGIDMSQLLSFGTKEQVREACMKAIDIASPGYFVGSTTELDNSSNLDNILTMLETAWTYKRSSGRSHKEN